LASDREFVRRTLRFQAGVLQARLFSADALFLLPVAFAMSFELQHQKKITGKPLGNL
jgi:hypothetical protein